MQPFVIVVAHKKGGTGKSSIVMNISVQLNKKHSLTLIDFDSQQQTSKFNAHRKSPMNIKHVLENKELISFTKHGTDDLIIIDLGGYDSNLQRQAILLADLLIIPLNDSDNEEDGLIDFRKILKEIRKIRTDLKGYLLLTRLHHADTTTHKALKILVNETDDLKLLKSTVADITIHKRMLKSGKNVIELNQNKRAIKDIINLTEEIERIINEKK